MRSQCPDSVLLACGAAICPPGHVHGTGILDAASHELGASCCRLPEAGLHLLGRQLLASCLARQQRDGGRQVPCRQVGPKVRYDLAHRPAAAQAQQMVTVGSWGALLQQQLGPASRVHHRAGPGPPPTPSAAVAARCGLQPLAWAPMRSPARSRCAPQTAGRRAAHLGAGADRRTA